MKAKRVVLVLFGILAFSACASAGGGVGNTDPTRFTANLGRVSYSTLSEGVDKIFRKYAIPIYRRNEQYATINIESEWVVQDPQPDEREQGITRTRTRFILDGRRSGSVFRISLTVEHQVRTERTREWQELPLTPDFRKWVQRVVQDLEAEIRTGVR
ncbi:MAG: hypothetical protein ACE5GJ_01190 [Gemmatimonadota bacterium]